ncbi:AsmA family protein [Flavobacteriaceae bacterium F89]|uniref:AsmA family protein n=1 Tax=Cerina litoralis TaxID=2874477 RepID=A0AAE3JNI5_9FLAO|nr:AsmA-like C-terminal region-containing protein [Cerina litoralis]MCG2459914.1 AsmA family protein [Cerina litoralis]
MKKKILKIIGITLLLFIGLLIAAPFFLKGKIADIIKSKVDHSINATFDFADADLTLFSSFPQATLTLNEISLINKAPFEGDTLFASKEVSLNMSIKELFKDANEPININRLSVDKPRLFIKVDKDGKTNYDVAKESQSTNNSGQKPNDNFVFSLQSYEINGGTIKYDDLASGIHLEVLDMDHSGKGDLSAETSELDTHTSALVSFEMDSTNYLNKNQIQWDALIGVDLNQNKYTFLKNELLVNQLPLVFDGFIKLNEDNQEVDINFKTPSSDFKNFLAVIPEVYTKDIKQVKTSGNFTVEGKLNGIVDEEHIPLFNIAINSNDASFQYPDLPKSVRDIYIDTQISNTTGIVEDTEVDIRKLSFMIDQDKFNMSSKITELMGNPKVSAQVDGRINLENISKAYPIDSDLNLKGILNADIATAFDMASVEKKQYKNTKTSGTLDLQGFEYKSDEIPNVVKLNQTKVLFTPKTVDLKELKGKTGKTDFDITGTLNNLLGFMFNDEKVEGRFILKSDTFSLNDFMVPETAETNKKAPASTPSAENTDKIKIPSFLDCSIAASAKTVIYDNLILKNVSGNLQIIDEKAVLSNMTSSIFDGKLGFSGEVSTKGATPEFAMTLGMDKLNIAETFTSLDLLKALAPIAGYLQGRLNSDIEISGNLNDDFTPNLNTLSGDVLAAITTTNIDAGDSPLLSALNNKLNFIDMGKLQLNDLKTKLAFKDGIVQVKPFTVNYQDIAINVSGSHTFDKKLNYQAQVNVPVKYLGKEVNNLIAKIDEKSLKTMTIPVTASIGGQYSSPTVTTDLTSGVKKLTAELIEVEKQKLLAKGTDKAKELIGGILGSNTAKKDSLKEENSTSDDVENVIGGLLGGNTEKQDTSATKKDSVKPKANQAENAAKEILGGLLGGKKKKDTVN